MSASGRWRRSGIPASGPRSSERNRVPLISRAAGAGVARIIVASYVVRMPVGGYQSWMLQWLLGFRRLRRRPGKQLVLRGRGRFVSRLEPRLRRIRLLVERCVYRLHAGVRMASGSRRRPDSRPDGWGAGLHPDVDGKRVGRGPAADGVRLLLYGWIEHRKWAMHRADGRQAVASHLRSGHDGTVPTATPAGRASWPRST
jgi:hypothetical protein